eukprot:GHVH01017023.1.p1 GENE.GHVH01017023.1~~GHVH01017023.1.p1  ORF type:complete len:340 (-),score=20.03 GHVH01017023.1:533-1552(-)
MNHQQKMDNGPSLTSEQLNIFRTKLCVNIVENRACPNKYDCLYTHCRTWARRNPSLYQYSASMCPHLKFQRNIQGRMELSVCKCDRGRHCPYAHTMEEQMYHPEIFKTSMCRAYPDCDKRYCPFAHGKKELRTRKSEGETVITAISRSKKKSGQKKAHELPQTLRRKRLSVAPENYDPTILPRPSETHSSDTSKFLIDSLWGSSALHSSSSISGSASSSLHLCQTDSLILPNPLKDETRTEDKNLRRGSSDTECFFPTTSAFPHQFHGSFIASDRHWEQLFHSDRTMPLIPMPMLIPGLPMTPTFSFIPSFTSFMNPPMTPPLPAPGIDQRICASLKND